jgi:hypothetical protein
MKGIPYVQTFSTSYEYENWVGKRRNEIRIISVTAFKNELVVTYEI